MWTRTGKKDAVRLPRIRRRPDPASGAPTDAELVSWCAGGSRAALRALFDRHGSVVYASAQVTARRTGAPPADDLVVTAFTTLWRELRTGLDEPSNVLHDLLATVGRAAALGAPVPALEPEAAIVVELTGGPRQLPQGIAVIPAG